MCVYMCYLYVVSTPHLASLCVYMCYLYVHLWRLEVNTVHLS